MKTALMVSVLILVVLAAPVSRYVKSNVEYHPVSQTEGKSEILANFAAEPDIFHLGTVAAANQGPYYIRGYQHTDCPGSIAVLPLYRNAEGGEILKRMMGNAALRYGVLFKGEIYDEFPQFSYAAEYALQGIKGIWDASSRTRVEVLAFAELGQCKLAEKIGRYTL